MASLFPATPIAGGSKVDRSHSPGLDYSYSYSKSRSTGRLGGSNRKGATFGPEQTNWSCEKPKLAANDSRQAIKDRKLQEIYSMKKTNAGRSFLLVEDVIKITEPYAAENIEPVGRDETVFLAQNMMKRQDKFRLAGKPTHVSVGFHYTKAKNIEAIRNDGLLTIEERQAIGSSNTRNIAQYGNGIYTGTNHEAFSGYGDIGLIVGVLRGNAIEADKRSLMADDFDALIGNKTGDSPFHDEIILQRSSQVLPLVKFERNRVLDDSAFVELIWELHQDIQRGILDKYFNGFSPTTLNRIRQTKFDKENECLVRKLQGRPPLPVVPVTSPLSLWKWPTHPFPQVVGLNSGASIQVPFTGQTTVFKFGQAHAPPPQPQINFITSIPQAPPTAFFKSNVEETITYTSAGFTFTFNHGKSPDGTMTVTTSNIDCEGMKGWGSITIEYWLPGGVQKACHQNPGFSYSPCKAVAYLPNIPLGQALLKRLKYSFRQGVTFMVGTNPSTRMPNCILCVIHHKTARSGGTVVNGWPDPDFFDTCNRQLDSLQVPRAEFL